jgi:hypothetical protein
MIILKKRTKNNDKIITTYSEEFFKGVPVKSVKINNKKYIVIKDLEDYYGKGISRVLKGKTTLRKIRFGSSTQSRRIVNISDLRGIFSKIVIIQPSSKPQNVKAKPAEAMPAPAPTPANSVSVVAKVEATQMGLFDHPQEVVQPSVIDRFAEVSRMRKAISGVCYDMSRDALDAAGYTPQHSGYGVLKEDYYKKAYIHILSEFRRALEAKLVSMGKSLVSEGLQKQKKYVDVLEEKGYLDVFYSFVMSNYAKNYCKQLN